MDSKEVDGNSPFLSGLLTARKDITNTLYCVIEGSNFALLILSLPVYKMGHNNAGSKDLWRGQVCQMQGEHTSMVHGQRTPDFTGGHLRLLGALGSHSLSGLE